MIRTRRWVLSRGAATVAAAAAAGGATIGDPATAGLPKVNMELVLLAAQLDPPKPDTGLTPGAGGHVLRVEDALDAEGLLAPAYVDGHFGTATVSAYAAWQRLLGFSGIDANGIPGRTSLTALGEGRFRVVRTVSTGSRYDSYGGERVNTRTRNMLAATDATLAWGLVLTQGSYTDEDPTSAGTHSGGGAADIAVNGLSTSQRWETVQALRTVGFAAWLRNPSQGSWPHHIHAIAVSDPDLSKPARDQVNDYYFGRNGLANNLPDDTPPEYQAPFTWWEKHLRCA